MTYGELALLRYILEQVKEGNKVSLSADGKIDTNCLYNYFNNVITDIEKDKIKNPKIEYQAIRLWVDVSKVRGVEDGQERRDEKEKDPEKSKTDQGQKEKRNQSKEEKRNKV